MFSVITSDLCIYVSKGFSLAAKELAMREASCRQVLMESVALRCVQNI